MQSANFLLAFPAESRDPFLRRSELLKQLKYLASEDGLVPQNDRLRLSSV
jgi:hypothetical protein